MSMNMTPEGMSPEKIDAELEAARLRQEVQFLEAELVTVRQELAEQKKTCEAVDLVLSRLSEEDQQRFYRAVHEIRAEKP